jgi:hypothetical protein
MQAVKAANLLWTFLLELCMLAALAYWGFTTGQNQILQIGLGIGAPLIVIILWGIWMAPKSPRRLRGKAYLALKLILFGAAAAALFVAGRPYLAAFFVLFSVVNQGLIFIWNQ